MVKKRSLGLLGRAGQSWQHKAGAQQRLLQQPLQGQASCHCVCRALRGFIWWRVGLAGPLGQCHLEPAQMFFCHIPMALGRCCEYSSAVA